jgi:hypothetical protein
VLPGRVFTLAVPNRKYKLKTCKYLMNMNKYSVVGIATRYRLDGPGIESRCAARSSTEPRLAPRHIPTSYTMEAGSFLGVKWPGGSFDHALPSSVGVKERDIPLHPFWAFVACSRVNFKFTFTFNKFPYIRLNVKVVDLRKYFF